MSQMTAISPSISNSIIKTCISTKVTLCLVVCTKSKTLGTVLVLIRSATKYSKLHSDWNYRSKVAAVLLRHT